MAPPAAPMRRPFMTCVFPFGPAFPMRLKEFEPFFHARKNEENSRSGSMSWMALMAEMRNRDIAIELIGCRSDLGSNSVA